MSAVGNWHAALANNLPDEIEALHAEVAELDRKKADRLDLIRDYDEMLVIARRRMAGPTAPPTQGE